MKNIMNKQLYNFIQGHFQKNRQGAQIKNTALATKLYEEYNFGRLNIDKTLLIFGLKDILTLCEQIQSELGADIRHDIYPTKESRLNIANEFRNEKVNSYAVSKDFILINSLSEFKINKTQHNISPLASLGIYIRADDINSIEHKSIIFVENLAVMANLSSLNLTLLSEELTDALWVYRGDIKKQQSTGTAYEFFRRFNTHQRICFSDVDPKGIEIALTSHANYWLSIKNIADYIKVCESLKGNEQEWFNQSASIKFLQKKLMKNNEDTQKKPTWSTLFTASSAIQKTLKQEHILTHQLALTLLNLEN